ncbi:MAG TPA: response regulator [Chloroflexota bacterium]|nr:response regulator [Chloroflexota bacterium]
MVLAPPCPIVTADRVTILVVGHQAANREPLAAYLGDLACEVREAADSESALALARAAPPDLILIDVTLKDVDGYAVTTRLKGDPRTAPVPIVLLTALEDRAARLRGLEAGADEFLTKPVDRAELSARVRTLVQLKRLRDARQAEAVRDAETGRADERGRLEEQLRQAQKMEAIGRLAGGVAHDFNNLLTAINGYSEVLLAEMAPDAPLRLYVQEIVKAGERATQLTQQLLVFSRKNRVAPEVLNLNAVVAETAGFLRRLIGEDVVLRTRLDPAIGRVRVDPGQLQQVLMNLAVNARDAMPEGGRLTIETANVDLDAPAPRTFGDVPPGAYVMLAVSDTGCGMDAATQAHIFEPFFTTKAPSKGTGLGLSTVYGIVQHSGGHIWVYSEPARGSVFKIYLPRVADASAPPAAPVPPAAAAGGAETILVVEDDEQVRALMVSVLQNCGYRVLEAGDGIQALLVIGQHGGPLDLLVTDVVLPGMSGRDVAAHVAGLRPDVAVLYISGYADHAAVQHGVLDAESALLQKPFTPLALANKVREALDARPTAKAARPSARRSHRPGR